MTALSAKDRETRLVAANQILATFSRPKLSIANGRVYVNWDSLHKSSVCKTLGEDGKYRGRRAWVTRGNDFFPVWRAMLWRWSRVSAY